MINAIRRVAASILVVATVGAAMLPAASARTVLTQHAYAMQILAEEPRLEGSFYACMYRLYHQGLRPEQVQAHCESRLVAASVSSGRDLPEGFSPDVGDSRTLSCPGRWAGPASAPSGAKNFTHPKLPDHDLGGYTWGGKGEVKRVDPDTGEQQWYRLKGLTETEARLRKAEAADRYVESLKAWGAAWDEYTAAARRLDEAKATGDAAQVAAAEAAFKAAAAKRDAAAEERDKALKAAESDPNKAPPSVSQPASQDTSACAEALAFLTECDRVEWSTHACQELLAKANNCADPALIYPDPLGGGVACGEPAPPAEDIAAAVELWCSMRIDHGPDTDPCSGEVAGLTLRSWIWPTGAGAVCNSPYAYVTEDSCAVTITLAGFGTKNVQSVLAVGLSKLGGPVWVMPSPSPICPTCRDGLPAGPHGPLP
ncbi:hypothetical protein AFL01nite_27050 [Aeromicrobium flavum]|uniref:Uncharacterized protein n=2 Tax=Aeromicrobium flavum TaxID=416568 RepID=A0A512HY47_9ACTN|nr:hypothetical protein AFL01nite_27050 [Aeromicrobium flavum]